MLQNFIIEKIYQYLLISLAFLMPITVAGGNILLSLICFLWLFSGDYKNKFNMIFRSTLMIASIVFYLIHVLGMLWTEDFLWGFRILKKNVDFLIYLPVLYTIVKKEYIKYYISAFLLAISITEVLSYLIWFEIIPPFKYASVYNPSPFMSHISYNPILAFAIYLLSHEVLMNYKLSKVKRYLYAFFSISMSINMFITGGRAGQVMFFGVIAILFFQYFNGQKIKSILLFSITSSLIFLTAYQSSNIFHDRVNSAVSDIQNYSSNKATSVGLRLTFTINSWELILKNPLIGQGTGDFPNEYKKINLKNTPNLPNTTNPHNMYTLILAQLGSIGLISFLAIFYYQLKFALKSKDGFIKDIGIAMPLLFLLIMWSDSYLLGHYTSLMYVLFSSFLYKDFEKI